jgi:hypothetical protein
MFNLLFNDTFHRVELRKEGCWTFFMTSRRVLDRDQQGDD